MAVNPYSLLLEACNTSERAFRREYGFAKQTLVDVTAGGYENLSERMTISLGKLCYSKDVVAHLVLVSHGYPPTLEEAYQQWRLETRIQNRDTFVRYELIQLPDSPLSPAAEFIDNTAGSPTAFSKQLLVPPQTVRRWSNGVSRLTPLSIEKALRSIGYPYIRKLIEAQATWYDRKHS